MGAGPRVRGGAGTTGFVDSAVVLARLRGSEPTSRWPWIGAALGLVVAAPLIVSGPGNDLDVANIFRSGRSIAQHLSYVPSRPPGAPVHELIVGVLDLVGGPVLTNLSSLAAAAALLVGLDRLLRREGIGPGGRWAVALVGACPWFVIAATSTAEYVFALAFVIAAALALRRGHPVVAGLLAAASMGCRVGSGALVAAFLLAELTEPRAAANRVGDPDEPHDIADATTTTAFATDTDTAETTSAEPTSAARSPRRAVLITAVVAGLGTIAAFVPSYLSAHGLSFAENDFSTSSVAVQIGRGLAKDLNLLGPPATLVALLALPALAKALASWRASWLVRFATVGFVLSQILFLRFPWKMPHLLPCLLCLAILLGVALEAKPRLLIALVALQLAFCVLRVNVVRPDDPNQATGGKVGVTVGWGPVITDWQCRREHPDAYRGRQKVEVEGAWDCAAPFGR
ncbi:MAG: hypothetical protein JWM89_1049 [Acidimicrobiales bacterium]|nr:hypothetical protein [Acidimicrobiales bacterium]